MMVAPIPMDEFTGPDIQQLVGIASELFDNRNCGVIRVPARLCLAADHTDYWEIFTPELVTFASDSAMMWAVISPRTDASVLRELLYHEGVPARTVANSRRHRECMACLFFA